MVNLDCSREVEITAKIMVVCLILLLLAVLFVVFLHLYVNRFLRRRSVEEPPLPTAPGSRRRRRPHGHSVINLDFTDPGKESMQMGLDPAVLRSLPIVIMEAKDFEDGGLECCAVCLSDVEPGEKARLLPSCNHVFHVDCIDLWFLSHSTCPLCRYSVAPQNIHQSPQENSANSFGYATESHPNFPTNVLFWGDQSRVLSSNGYNNNGSCLGTEFSNRTPPSSSSPPASSSLPDQLAPQSSSSASSSSSSPDARPEQILMIDVPPQLMSHSFAEDEFKSPTVTNCRSLKTLLMGEKNGAT